MSSEAKPTPGPWTYHEADAYDIGQIIGADGSVVCGFGSCHEDDEYGSSGVPPGDEDLALILAAPDLLEALEMVRDADDDCISAGLPRWCTDAARARIDAAIAKAKGESQ